MTNNYNNIISNNDSKQNKRTVEVHCSLGTSFFTHSQSLTILSFQAKIVSKKNLPIIRNIEVHPHIMGFIFIRLMMMLHKVPLFFINILSTTFNSGD